jgi:tripeptidyl-peptidase-1
VDDTPAAAAEQRRTHFLRRGVNGAATADTAAATGTVRNFTKQWQQYQRNEEPKNVLKSQPHGSQQRQRTQGKELQGYITPSVIDRIYNIAASAHDGKNYGSQAVYETIGQTFSPSDLEEFQTFFELRVQAVSEVIGGHSDNHACESNYANDCVEANLDVQYMMAVAQNVPTVYYYWKGQDFLLDWITQVAQMSSPPLVFSISYGIDEWSLSAEYAHEFDIQAMKLGVRGVTILASSGDDGAVTSQAADNELNCMYSPDFPASSPYVTSVGGTMVSQWGK